MYGQTVREKDVSALYPWKDVLWLSETKAQGALSGNK